MTEPNSEQLRYWVDQVCQKIVDKYPTGDLRVCSGISPSGPYHIGHSREILTADAIKRGLVERGRNIEHVHFVDDFDALRKRYPYLPESFETEVGKPLFMVKAPDGVSSSYAEQFASEYLAAVEQLGVQMTVVRIHEKYQDGTFADCINTALNHREEIAAILNQVSGRSVEADWLPIQILDESSDNLRTAKFIGYDEQLGKVHYLGQDGKEYSADITRGQVKLDWRVHWPAWWTIWGNQVEGFGREHATKGGSYDTGVEIAKQIFGTAPPIPVPYETINLKGDTKKMSSSLGNLVSIKAALDLIPAEVLRYFTFKSRPERQLFFDPGIGLYNLIDEYAKTESLTLAGEEPEFKRAWQIATLRAQEHVISTVPFSHLVTVYQTADGDNEKIMDILRRSGHSEAVKSQQASIERELKYVAAWLDNYAPDKVKFSVLAKRPTLAISDQHQAILSRLADELQSSDHSADAIHNAIYEQAVNADIKPAEIFKLLYQLFIGQDAGPRLGFFLASLDQDFVLKRLRGEA